MQKGTPGHLYMGRVWGGVMACAALSSFAVSGIQRDGLGRGAGRASPLTALSPIHVLSCATLASVPVAWKAARDQNIGRFNNIMRGNFAGMCIAMTCFYFSDSIVYGSIWSDVSESGPAFGESPAWFG